MGPCLTEVMADAIQRWFVDTLRNAKNGDVNQAGPHTAAPVSA